MTTKALSDDPTCQPEDAVCCPPEGSQAEALLSAPVDGAAADEELAAFGKALGHPTRVRILRILARKEVLAGFRQVRTVPIWDRIGHSVCTVALWPTIQR